MCKEAVNVLPKDLVLDIPFGSGMCPLSMPGWRSLPCRVIPCLSNKDCSTTKPQKDLMTLKLNLKKYQCFPVCYLYDWMYGKIAVSVCCLPARSLKVHSHWSLLVLFSCWWVVVWQWLLCNLPPRAESAIQTPGMPTSHLVSLLNRK